MKAFKILGIVLLSICLFFSLMTLMLSVSVKDIFENKLMVTAFKTGVMENVPEEDKKEVSKALDEVLKYPEVSELIDAVLNDYINYDSNKGVSDKTIDLIMKFAVDHADDIKKISGEDFNINEIDTPENRQALREGMNKVYDDNIENDSDAQSVKDVLKAYNDYTSDNYWKIMAGIVLLIISLIALISWSYYRWMQPVGIVSIIASVFTFLFYGGLYGINMLLKESTDMNLTVTSNVVLWFAIIEIVLGITFLIVHSNLLNRERQNNQIATV